MPNYTQNDKLIPANGIRVVQLIKQRLELRLGRSLIRVNDRDTLPSARRAPRFNLTSTIQKKGSGECHSGRTSRYVMIIASLTNFVQGQASNTTKSISLPMRPRKCCPRLTGRTPILGSPMIQAVGRANPVRTILEENCGIWRALSGSA